MEEKPSKRFRKLRIAWSIMWGVAALLLIVLCVRSYWWANRFVLPVEENNALDCWSFGGELWGDWGFDPFDLGQPGQWFVENMQVLDPDEQGVPTVPIGICGFKIQRGAGSTFIKLPYWFLVVLCAPIAALAWIRFSLRSLLIATTLIALLLGLVVYAGRNLSTLAASPSPLTNHSRPF